MHVSKHGTCYKNIDKHQFKDFYVIREEKEPLRPSREQLNLNGDKTSLTVEYDGRQVLSKSGEIIGKHSAV